MDMKEQEIINRYGNKMAKKILDAMEGQTVGVNEDGSEDFYEYDVTAAYNAAKSKAK